MTKSNNYQNLSTIAFTYYSRILNKICERNSGNLDLKCRENKSETFILNSFRYSHIELVIGFTPAETKLWQKEYPKVQKINIEFEFIQEAK
jgi:hypothetical protein